METKDGFTFKRLKKNEVKIKNKKNEEIKEDFKFKTIKKRKTIQMEEPIDIKSENISNSSKSIIKLELPQNKEKIKSTEIHQNLKEKNLNHLIIECIKFLNIENGFSNLVRKYCKSNYFTDINYLTEINKVKEKKKGIQKEIEKWKNIKEFEEKKNIKIYEEIMKREEVEIEKKESNIKAEMKKVEKLFEEKAQRLFHLEEKLNYSLEKYQKRTNVLLRNIFKINERNKVDPYFLLKAMSKINENV